MRPRVAARSSGLSSSIALCQPVAVLPDKALQIADIVRPVRGDLFGHAQRLAVKRGRVGGETELEQFTGGRAERLHPHLFEVAVGVDDIRLVGSCIIAGRFDQDPSGVLETVVPRIDRNQALGGSVVEIQARIGVLGWRLTLVS